MLDPMIELGLGVQKRGRERERHSAAKGFTISHTILTYNKLFVIVLLI